MSELLTDKDRPLHRARPGDNLSSVARARTLTVLSRLDGDRKARVIQFLHEAGLITEGRPVLALAKADLSSADLREANLNSADLRGATMSGADLSKANLSGADLSAAALSGVGATGASTFLRVVREAGERGPRRGPSHSTFYLEDEWSEDKSRTMVQVSAAKSLEGATMPNGQKYEEWREDH